MVENLLESISKDFGYDFIHCRAEADWSVLLKGCRIYDFGNEGYDCVID